MSRPPYPARQCWTCKNRRAIEVIGMSPYASLWEQRCKAFRNDLLGRAEMMNCGEAYDRFCGGGDWKPDFWARVLMILGYKIK